MKKIVIFFAFLTAPLIATQLEISQFEEIRPLVDSTTLVLVDLDNTLFESELMLGSAPWRGYFRKKMAMLQIPETERKRMLDVYWDFLQNSIPVRLIDPESGFVIEKLREEGILVFGFTRRAKREMNHTERQLESLGVRFTPFSAPIFDREEDEATFEKGVIYCGELEKADALAALLHYVQIFDRCCAPETVVAVDDHEEHLLSIEPIADSFHIKYIGARFNGADRRTTEFNGDIVEYQWRHLPLLVSDSEALEKIAQLAGPLEKSDQKLCEECEEENSSSLQ